MCVRVPSCVQSQRGVEDPVNCWVVRYMNKPCINKEMVAAGKAGSKKSAAAAAAAERNKAAMASLPPVMEDSPEPPEEMDILLGCTKCRYLKGGCGACRDKPALERPKSLRWKPDALRQQKASDLVQSSAVHLVYCTSVL